MRRPPLLACATLLAFAAVVPGPAAAQQDTAAANDTTLLGHAARMARAKHAQIIGPAGLTDAGSNLYRNAQADMATAEWGDAALALTAALSRAPRNPLYRGELAFMVARGGNLDSAATLYQQAWSLQQGNGWYLIGLAVVRAAQTRWADAAGTITVAAQADSSVVDGRVASTAVAYFQLAQDNAQALEWARIAVQRAPDDANSWFILARAYAERDDTTGLAAARRYTALRPDEPFGKLILAHMLFLSGKGDSALTLAEEVSADTAYAEAASVVFLRAGARLLQRDLDRGLAVLNRGRPSSPASLQPAYAYYIGRGQLAKAGALLSDVEERRDCALAQRAESLVVDIDRNLRDGISMDSARATQLLEEVLPSYRRNAQNFRETFCRPQPAPRQPARPRRP
jgi:Tfp pilus assembly protein PilF